MRHSTRALVADLVRLVDLPGPVYEFGALQVDPADGISDLRPLFDGLDFVGCDMRDGPGVDRILDLLDLDLPDESVGTAVALDTLEHVTDCHTALRELHRVLQPGGWLVITSVMFFPIHEHPDDYWRFTPSAFEHLLGAFDDALVLAQGWPDMPHTVMGVARKGASIDDGVADELRRHHHRDDVGPRLAVQVGPMRIPYPDLVGLAARQLPGEVRRVWRRRRG